MASEDTSWRQLIVNQLQKRNHCETNAFRELILLNHRLFDNVNTLKNENLQLTLHNERIRVSGYEGSQLANGNNDGQPTLEQRLLAQQEELTALHRRRGENSQEIITLNAKLHEAEKKLAAKDSSLSESCAINASLRAEIQMYENNMQELQGLNQMLRDEHQALQIAFSSLEEKLRKCQDENRQLVERLIKYKATDADKMNEENETYIKRKGERMRKELEEAARDGGTKSSGSGGGSSASNDDKYMDGVPFFASVLPSKVALRFEAHDGDVNAVRWSPTDRLIATGGADRKVKLWDVSKVGVCEKKGTLVGSNAGVMSVDFDSTGTLILASSNDFASRVWSVADQRLRHTLTGHSGKVMAAKFLGELTKVISGSHDRTIKIWDLRSRACIVTKFVGSSCNDLVTADGAGSTIISGHYDKRVRFWDARTDTSSHDILLHGRITSLDISRDCNYLLACVRDDSIQLIDLRNSSILRQFSHDGFKVGCDWARASFSPGGRLVAAGGVDGGVYIWATHSGKLEAVLRDHSCAVTAVAWQPHAGLLASVDRGKNAIVWGDV